MNFRLKQVDDSEYELLDENGHRIGRWVQRSDEWVSIEIVGRPNTFARDLGDAHLVSWSELRQLELETRSPRSSRPWWKFWSR